MPPRKLILGFCALLFVLLALSPARRVGDAREYLAMAMTLARFRPPALSPVDRAEAERRLADAGFGGQPLAYHPELTDAAGRQDFFHFWFYPALAVPGIWITGLFGLNPNHAFTALNVLMFLAALWTAARRLPAWAVSVIFCSPVLWWIDKAHTEAFTFSLIAVALVLVRDAPWWAMVCLGAAATQNPPCAVLLGCVGIVSPLVRPGLWRDRRFLAGGAAALTLALLHPAYYEWRWRLPTPQLVLGTHAHAPTLQEIGAVLWDPNIGIVVHAPLLVLVVVVAAAIALRRAPSRLLEAPVLLAVAGAAIFLLSFSQATNVNSGGTPGMSRYAVWLIPLAIPVLRCSSDVLDRRPPRWFLVLVLGSCAWTVASFAPGRAESYVTPTRVASFLWSRLPSLDNPLPEIFAERLSGEEPGLVPIATPDCAKVLLFAGRWPVPCVPTPVPAQCEGRRALCYANRGVNGYDFATAGSGAGSALEPHRTWTWTSSTVPDVERVLNRVRWRELRRFHPSAPGAMLRASCQVSWADGLQSDDALVVYVAEPRQGASLALSLPGTMSGSLIDPRTGDDIQQVLIESPARDLVGLELPSSRAVVLVLTRDR